MFMVAGIDIIQEEKEPIEVESGVIDYVESFQYLGSIIADDGRIDAEIDKCIAPVHQELLVLLDRQYLKMIIYQLTPRGKISHVCYLFYFMEENAEHL